VALVESRNGRCLVRFFFLEISCFSDKVKLAGEQACLHYITITAVPVLQDFFHFYGGSSFVEAPDGSRTLSRAR
jgi:hypothetical protein